MSLHVYLKGEEQKILCRCQACDNEHERPLSEWFYSANITHNLGAMAQAAGIYTYLWRPEEAGVERAGQLIAPLSVGLASLLEDPARVRVHNPPNGWGNYEILVEFVRAYLAACRQYPTARVAANR